MTNLQSDILQYLSIQFKGCHYDLIGDDKVKVTDRNGKSITFTCNLNGDIIDANTKKILTIESTS